MIKRMLYIWIVSMVIVAIVGVLRFNSTDFDERRRINERNRYRDTAECQRKRGTLSLSGICFDVDSIIPLVGIREDY